MKKRFGFVLILICMGFVLSEWSLRIAEKILSQKQAAERPPLFAEAFETEGDFYGKYGDGPEIQYDFYLGFSPKPLVKKVLYRINEHGFRSPESFPVEKPKDEIRIFITGGSAAWGTGVLQEKTFPVVIEKRFKEKYPEKKVRVVNAGCPIHNSTQERTLFQNRLLAFSPDIVVMFSGWNDVYYAYSGARIFVENDYYKFREMVEGKNFDGSFLLPPVYDDYSLKLRFLFDRMRHQIHWRNRRRYGKAIEKRTRPQEEVVEGLIRNIHFVWDAANRHKVKFVFALQPEMITTKRKLTTNEEALLEDFRTGQPEFFHYMKENYGNFRQAISADSTKEGYFYLDPDDAFWDEEKSIFVDDVHYGDRGHRIMGNYLFEVLEGILQDPGFQLSGL